MKKMVWLMILTLFFMSTSFSTVGAADADSIQLWLDADNNGQILPKNFRLLTDLQASGSSQYSADGLQALKKAWPTAQVTVVDLREESHGFADGMAISWYGYRNWANIGKKETDIVQQENVCLAALMEQNQVTIVKDIKKDVKDTRKTNQKSIADDKQNIIMKHIHSAISEEALTKEWQVGYYRLTITDHHGSPPDNQIDQFISFVSTLPPDTWLHFHCEEGHGRTTTFLAMYDMMRNSKTIDLIEIINRQHQAGGIDLFDNSQQGWEHQYVEERAEFLKTFYNYCRSNQDGFQTSWSSWHRP